MNTEQALNDYQKVLDGLEKLEANHSASKEKLSNVKAKIEAWFAENTVELEQTPEWLIKQAPQVAWAVSKKTDGLAVELHMAVDDRVIPEKERELKEQLKPLKDMLEAIENWALAQLLERGAKNFKTDDGTASLRTDVKYSIADKSLFIKSMQEKGAESELTITVRPNSKAIAKILDDDGEYPAGLTAARFNKVVFVKT